MCATARHEQCQITQGNTASAKQWHTHDSTSCYAVPLSHQPLRLAISLAPAIALLFFAAALSVPGTGVLGLVALWTPIVAEEVWSIYRTFFRRPSPRPVRPTAELSAPAFGLIAAAPVAEPQADGEVTQQLTRSRAADGTETLSGWLRLAFAPGQRQATAHLSFCPAFAQAPLLEVRQTEGPAARVKTGQVLPYGVRLEVKLASPAGDAITVRLAFSARSGDATGR